MKTTTSAKVIACSKAHGTTLTTLQITFPRFILAEFNTHRKFSRNSASSRAISAKKLREMVIEDPFIPQRVFKNQPGMQGSERLDDISLEEFQYEWVEASKEAVNRHIRMERIGAHKQHANRILEPYMWHTALVSSTEWKNFDSQRDSSLAQPEMEDLAKAMIAARESATPVKVGNLDWHLPYIDGNDEGNHSIEDLTKISVARSTRVCYNQLDGRRDVKKDLDLYKKLINANPPHWSPLEHVAQVYSGSVIVNWGNFDRPWHQLRKLLEESMNSR